MSEFPFDLNDIAKTIGGLMAFVVVLYIGVLFYKKEASFSDEYNMLLEQYRLINDDLLEKMSEQKKSCEIEIQANRTEIFNLKDQIKHLQEEISYLKGLLTHSQTPEV